MCVCLKVILSTEHNYFLTDDYCRREDSCQFIIHSSFSQFSTMQKQVVSLIRGVMCCVYSLL